MHILLIPAIIICITCQKTLGRCQTSQFWWQNRQLHSDRVLITALWEVINRYAKIHYGTPTAKWHMHSKGYHMYKQTLEAFYYHHYDRYCAMKQYLSQIFQSYLILSQWISCRYKFAFFCPCPSIWRSIVFMETQKLGLHKLLPWLVIHQNDIIIIATKQVSPSKNLEE